MFIMEQVPRWQPEHFLANLSAADLAPVLTARLVGNTCNCCCGTLMSLHCQPQIFLIGSSSGGALLHLIEPEPGKPGVEVS